MTAKLAEEMAECRVPARSVRLWWLGQAGFAFKTHAGRMVYVDPYLSDAVERLHGFKRLSPAPLAPEEARADVVVISHEHTDHLDPDTLPHMRRNNPACRFAAPAGCSDGLKQAGIGARNRIKLVPGKAHDLGGGIVAHAVSADHGDFSRTATSLLLDFDGIHVLYTGDTSWRPELLKPLVRRGVDLLLPCINGVFGNMNHLDAAMLTRQAAPRVAIPCHFWTFAEQGGGDPGGFIHACGSLAPKVRAMLLRPGEGFTLERSRAKKGARK
jgi:L-ascorbate 6-phosphate lactonase